MKLAIKSALLFIIFILTVLIWRSINEPIQFNKIKEIRYKATIQRLIDIRSAELAYLSANGHFTGNFDSLLHFIKYGSIPIIKAVGSVPDTLSEKDAISLGLVYRDTIFVKVIDSLFKPGYPIDSLPFVPFSGGKQFVLGARVLLVGSKRNESTISVPVFEAKVPNTVLLHGLNKQLRINLDDELIQMDKYPGLKVGSLEMNVNSEGNW